MTLLRDEGNTAAREHVHCHGSRPEPQQEAEKTKQLKPRQHLLCRPNISEPQPCLGWSSVEANTELLCWRRWTVGSTSKGGRVFLRISCFSVAWLQIQNACWWTDVFFTTLSYTFNEAGVFSWYSYKYGAIACTWRGWTDALPGESFLNFECAYTCNTKNLSV